MTAADVAVLQAIMERVERDLGRRLDEGERRRQEARAEWHEAHAEVLRELRTLGDRVAALEAAQTADAAADRTRRDDPLRGAGRSIGISISSSLATAGLTSGLLYLATH